MISISSYSKSFSQNFVDENKSISFGFHFGAVSQLQDWGLQIIMCDFTFYGVYIDFGGWPQSHGSDVRIDKWDADKAIVFHAGYQVPITSWLKITPMIGYFNNQSGWTDGGDWYADSYSIHNKFHCNNELSGFDFGGQIKFEIPCGKHTSFDIMGTFTKNCWYGGIGLGINL